MEKRNQALTERHSYFFLCDRFSDGNETGYLDNAGRRVRTGATPAYDPVRDAASALATASSAARWRAAGARFAGGTLRGAASKLGYLRRMGVTVVWLGPVWKQRARDDATYHGYGVQNFLEVEPRFGTREDLVALVSEAHGMGMYVILDIVL
jgi:glycosidase